MITFNFVPENPQTYKYDFLGELSILNHRQYCERHGYDFIGEVDIDHSRPVCWAKLPAVHKALHDYDWVLWADSDTLICDMSRSLQEFCDHRYDLIVQYQEHWWKLINLENGTERFPINSGVFLIRSSDWSLRFLEESYAQTQYVTRSEVWDRIGEQEGMNYVIRETPGYRERIKYAHGVQTSPLLFKGDDFMVHFYGDHLRHYIPTGECSAVLERWEQAIKQGLAWPVDIKRFHWCCAQNKTDGAQIVQGDLGMFLYNLEDIQQA